MDVPLDYDAPDGATVNIALTRKAASGGERHGVLLLNPGGPGGSGTELMYQLASMSIPQRITESFDLVSFDSRGVGLSAGIDCGTDVEGSISATYGDFLQKLGSYNVVRDMDRIRIALGEDKLNFLGYSYGTRLGSLYLELFPDTAGKLVLDASVPPAGDLGELTLPALLSYLDSDDISGMEEVVQMLGSFTDEPIPPSTSFNEEAALRAIECADDSLRMSDNDVVALLETYNLASDLFAELNLIYAVVCSGWPSALEPVRPVTAQSNGRALIIGGVSDTSTPLRWSEEMATAINSPLIVSEHIGHTVVFRDQNSCVDNQVISFLLDDKQPQVFRCPVDAD